jgi:hypothetical protein
MPIASVKDWQNQSTILAKETRKMLGLVSYYKRFLAIIEKDGLVCGSTSKATTKSLAN